MPFDRAQPYNDLPLLPPPVELETRAVLKQAISSNRVLANLRGLAAQIPNQGMLISSIALQEARLSSEIENIVTTNDELYRADADPEGKSDPHTKEVLRYREALYHGFQALKARPLTTNLFIEIVRLIKQTELDIRAIPGTALKNEAGEVVYTPPVGEAVIRDKLGNLEQFIHADDGIDPLVKMAVMHYQFEAIHPFPDGNGRTGRILNLLYLVEKGLLDIPVLCLSRYIIANRAAYYEGLRRVTESQDWENWILFMLRAIESTAQQTHDQVQRIRALMESVRARVQTEAPAIYSKDLIEVIFRHPYTKIQFVVDAGIAKRQTASTYLQNLAGLGILREQKHGREKYYINEALFNELAG
ncbi:Fic family protein [Methyloversatilis sp.]|uniref:Fic family protein n=1 Tax=Methyloversatilis sp. TaxID=2569862 RepID=UPI002736513E|nr:Fic/DOC family N-terminal domain-containing protein [Methyloversatilis sp.]MDP2869532.1 Fic/DOC family N-terminal domain-containing protein [Methyloversatilis sp.]MDP3456093.1 Fic/DOC family N-terminal domain-containing protein [Methyloversatilis sp.]MDP3577346.1 Fic/DOC family N-terminal domain-containing protein [Methyloversatilis sp.]